MNCYRRLAYMVCLYFGLALSSTAQINCGTEDASTSELMFALRSSESKLRRANYSLAVNAVIVHSDTTMSKFDINHVNQLLEQANVYFSKIGLSFFLKNGVVKNVNASKFQSFNTTDELALRKDYDALDAINIYFVKSIKDKDGNILNGYSSQPTYNTSSNKLFFSYANNNPEDFKILIEKTFLHEFGHYLGLLHTFQNSNSETISKRELVVRGVNGNCATTGDEICDTPADPFDRLQNASAFNCTAPYSNDLTDANGDTYELFFDNLMSYHIGCGNIFTKQQYERMESALSIRLSPTAEYQISSIQEANFLSIKPLKKKVFCAGESITLNLESTGLFKEDNTFSLELAQPNNSNFTEISASFFKDSVRVILPENLLPGTTYKFRISSSSPAISSFASESFQIKSIGRIGLSSEQTSINLGDETVLKVSMTGGGSWNFTLNESSDFININSSELVISVKPSKDTLYRITSAENLCGALLDSQTVAIKVISPRIVIDSSFSTEFCKNEIIRMPVSGLIIGNISKYKILLEGMNNSFLLEPSISPFSVNFILPSEVAANQSYQLKLTGDGLGDYSETTTLFIKETPLQPKIVSPVKYCFNSPSSPLTAEGDSLVWFLTETNGTPYTRIIPGTTEDGIYHYYVSQVSKSGCLSERSKIEVEVKPPVTANLSGSGTIVSGDSLKLKIELTGDAPWNIQMTDGSIFTSETSTFEYFVRPTNSSNYSLKKVENFCGLGFISGQVDVDVISPLSSPSERDHELLVFPIPADNYIDIISQSNVSENAEIHLYDQLGKEVLGEYIKIDNGFTRIKLPRVNSGSYILKVIRDHKTDSKKIFIR